MRAVRPGGGMLRCLALSLAIIALGNNPVSGQQDQLTRESMVAAAERLPGASKGRQDAPVTIVEFSDFQCTYCWKFWKETLPRIQAEYIDTGKVRLVYRHFVALGPVSERAAEAAECAGEQGQFWAYHDRLFESRGRLAFTDARLMAELRLNPQALDACLSSGRYRDRILSESALARRLGGSGTPTFLVHGQLLIGAHPFETFKRILDAMGKGSLVPAAQAPLTTPRP